MLVKATLMLEFPDELVKQAMVDNKAGREAWGSMIAGIIKALEYSEQEHTIDEIVDNTPLQDYSFDIEKSVHLFSL